MNFFLFYHILTTVPKELLMEKTIIFNNSTYLKKYKVTMKIILN